MAMDRAPALTYEPNKKTPEAISCLIFQYVYNVEIVKKCILLD